MDYLDWTPDDMDKVIYMMCNDTKFLGACLRKGITIDLFSSTVRQRFVKMLYDYFQKYQRSPGDDLIDVVANMITIGRGINAEDEDMYTQYFANIVEIGGLNISSEYLMDRIDFFIKVRIVNTVTNRLMKLQDTFGSNPDKPLGIISEAVDMANKTLGDSLAEAMTEDTIVDDYSDTAARFNIPLLDRAMGGGLKFGNYVLLLGFTGVGKSWLCVHLCKIAARIGNSVLYIPTELANRTAKIRLRMCMSGKTQDEINERPGEVKKIIEKSLVKKSNIFLLSEEEKMMSVESLPNVLDDIESRYGKRPRVIIFDSADDLQPPKGRYDNSRDANTAIHTYLKNFAKDNDSCVMSTVQAKAEAEKGWWLGEGMMADNINKPRKATRALSINATKGELAEDYCRLYFFKNSDGPSGSKVWVKRNLGIGQFVMDSGWYKHKEYWGVLSAAQEMNKEIYRTGFRGQTAKGK